MLTLIEKAQSAFDEKKALEMAEKMKTNSFTLDDFLDQMEQMKNLGSMEDLMKMIPGMDASKMAGAQIDEKQMAHNKAINIARASACLSR